MSADNHPDTVSEAEAAQMLGWTPAALRSHRLRFEAQQTADALPTKIAALLADWPTDTTKTLTGPQREAMGDLIVESDEDRPKGSRRRFALTRQGAEVARRVRCGRRSSPCADPPKAIRIGNPPRIRYDRDVVEAWAKAHPEVMEVARLWTETIPTEEAAKIAGLAVSTLKGSRSKAAQAQARIDAGEAQDGDHEAVASTPPWVWVGNTKRYRAADVRAWAARRAQEAGEDLLEIRPRWIRGQLFDGEALARMAKISPTVMNGYRLRARRLLEEAEDPRAARRAMLAGELPVPPHVRVEGRILYRAVDVRRWLARRAGG